MGNKPQENQQLLQAETLHQVFKQFKANFATVFKREKRWRYIKGLKTFLSHHLCAPLRGEKKLC